MRTLARSCSSTSATLPYSLKQLDAQLTGIVELMPLVEPSSTSTCLSDSPRRVSQTHSRSFLQGLVISGGLHFCLCLDAFQVRRLELLLVLDTKLILFVSSRLDLVIYHTSATGPGGAGVGLDFRLQLLYSRSELGILVLRLGSVCNTCNPSLTVSSTSPFSDDLLPISGESCDCSPNDDLSSAHFSSGVSS